MLHAAWAGHIVPVSAVTANMSYAGQSNRNHITCHGENAGRLVSCSLTGLRAAALGPRADSAVVTTVRCIDNLYNNGFGALQDTPSTGFLGKKKNITWGLNFFMLDSRRVLSPAPICCAILILYNVRFTGVGSQPFQDLFVLHRRPDAWLLSGPCLRHFPLVFVPGCLHLLGPVVVCDWA